MAEEERKNTDGASDENTPGEEINHGQIHENDSTSAQPPEPVERRFSEFLTSSLSVIGSAVAGIAGPGLRRMSESFVSAEYSPARTHATDESPIQESNLEAPAAVGPIAQGTSTSSNSIRVTGKGSSNDVLDAASVGQGRNRKNSVYSVDREVYDSVVNPDGGRNGFGLDNAGWPRDADINAILEESEAEPEVEKPTCLICLGRESTKRKFMTLPCSKKCNEAPVHKKCIYEWREQKTGNGSCPLCRSKLTSIDYTPPDLVGFRKLYRRVPGFKKHMVLSPVPKESGMLRAYMRVTLGGSMNIPTDFKFYIQRNENIRYPGGTLPDINSPKSGDIPLMTARRFSAQFKKRSPFSPNLYSRIDISLKKDFDKSVPADFVGYTQSTSLYGLNYNVMALEDNDDGRSKQGVNRETSMNDKSLGSKIKVHDRNLDIGKKGVKLVRRYKNRLLRIPSTKSEESAAGVSACKCVGVVNYTQNRFGAQSGPRRMKIAIPGVEVVWNDKQKEKRTGLGVAGLEDSSVWAKLHQDGYSENSEDEDDEPVFHRTVPKVEPSALQALAKSAKPENEDFVKNGQAFVGRNMQPYWLESIEAYSLDFNGRVTLPSNKNFQMELKSSLNAADDIRLQFGKVAENETEAVYTVDFQWPFSPIQAFGICLSSCDRKLGCA